MTGSLHEKQSHVHTAAGVLYRVLTGFSHPRRRWNPRSPGHDAVDSVLPHDSISLGYASIFQREKKRFGKIKVLHNKNQPVQINSTPAVGCCFYVSRSRTGIRMLKSAWISFSQKAARMGNTT
jgi:hypothetical protein